MGVGLQEFIHKLEVGKGSYYARLFLGVVAMIGLAVLYDLAAFRNLSIPEAMDAAQVGRNLSEGRGFSTRFIRPLSLHLLRERQLPKPPAGVVAASPESASNHVAAPLALPHPDLQNPPLYPLLVAGALGLSPSRPPLTLDKVEEAHLPDLWVTFLNQLIFVGAAVFLFLLGARLFDETVGWLGVALFMGSDLMWRYSASGLPTVLLTFFFLALVWVLVRLETGVREGDKSAAWMLRWAAAAGVIVGLGGLTRYAFAWVLLPVMVLMISWRGGRVGHLAFVTLAACLAVMAPWLARNAMVSGTAFGTAGFSLYQDTVNYPGDTLARTLEPDLRSVRMTHLRHKFFVQARRILEQELPRLGGSWVSAFFLVGLLLPFRSPALRQVRGLLLMALLVFVAAQAMGPAPPEEGLNPNSLVTVVAPLAFLFGAGFFMMLLEQTSLRIPPGRFVALGGFCVVMALPLIFDLMAPPASAVMFPPYYPPWIREKSERMTQRDVIMSDIPWAVAWYGNRPSVWLSLNYQGEPPHASRNDFAAIDQALPVRALYLSARFTKDLPGAALYDWRLGDADLDTFLRLRSDLVARWEGGGDTTEADFKGLAEFRQLLYDNWRLAREGTQDWASFLVGVLIKREVPKGFPMRVAYQGDRLHPELFLTDSEREEGNAIQSQ